MGEIKIKYSKYFPIPGEWIGIDKVLDENEDALTAFAEVNALVVAAFERNNRAVSFSSSEVVIDYGKEEKLTGDLAKDISSSPDLKTVDLYKPIVESDKFKHLKPVYEERRRQIVDKESREILSKSDEYCAKTSKQQNKN